MNRLSFRIALLTAIYAACALLLQAQNPEQLTEEQKRDFLLHAKVVKKQEVGKGTTGIWRLTLNDGKIEHDAAFQSINVQKDIIQYADGEVETDYRDSYKYNIAAFELGKLLGLEDMMAVTVERRVEGRNGSISWWLPFVLDEEDRQKTKKAPPDVVAWSKQLQKMNVFGALVYDTDRNVGNVLYSEDWHVWMIDFTRAFRRQHDLKRPELLVQCQRRLWEKLQGLDTAGIKEKTRKWLTDPEIKAVLARRDLIVSHFKKLITEKGESAVLYD